MQAPIAGELRMEDGHHDRAAAHQSGTSVDGGEDLDVVADALDDRSADAHGVERCVAEARSGERGDVAIELEAAPTSE